MKMCESKFAASLIMYVCVYVNDAYAYTYLIRRYVFVLMYLHSSYCLPQETKCLVPVYRGLSLVRPAPGGGLEPVLLASAPPTPEAEVAWLGRAGSGPLLAPPALIRSFLILGDKHHWGCLRYCRHF